MISNSFLKDSERPSSSLDILNVLDTQVETQPLNLSPNAPDNAHTSAINTSADKSKKPPPLTTLHENETNTTQTNAQWTTGLCPSPYLFPPFQFPYMYLPSFSRGGNTPTLTPPIITPPLIPRSNTPPKDTEAFRNIASEPKIKIENSLTDHLTTKTASLEPSSEIPESSFLFPPPSNELKSFSPHHYQVKWANHASRLSSFIGSLEGDVASSDTIISAKDGMTFYSHRLVLAAASPFFSRTLKDIPKDQQAVIVIPRASSRCIAAILTFCYSGVSVFAKEDFKAIVELADDLEIVGLLNARDNKVSRPLSVSPVFGFPHSASAPPSPFSLPFGTNRPFTPGSMPYWKANSEMNSVKRLKSESDATKNAKKSFKSRISESSMNALKQECFNSSASSLAYLNPHMVTSKSSSDIKAPLTITPRQSNSSMIGSRVLLWRFLLQLLHDNRYAPYYIRWLDRKQGIFRIMESDKVAQLWGLARKNKNMTYEKMSRGMRTYYKREIMFHLDGTKLIYRFNTEQPEIQHQLKCYDRVMDKNLETEDRQEKSSHEPRQSSPASSGEESVSTNSIFSQDVPSAHSIYGMTSLFSTNKNV